VDVNSWLIDLVPICDHRVLMGHFLVAIVFNRKREFVGVVVCEDVRLLLVEEFDTLLSVT
jgi:hypothetical protein